MIKEIEQTVTSKVRIHVCDLCGKPAAYLVTMAETGFGDLDRKISYARAEVCQACAQERLFGVFYPTDETKAEAQAGADMTAKDREVRAR